MSHISLLEAEENRDVIFATPCPQERGKRVKDFKPLHYATGPTPKSYLPFATPSTRRIDVATDIVAAMEEEKNDQGLKDIQGKQWKLFSVSPLFGYDPHSSPKLLTNHLRNNKNLGNINVRLQSGLRGNREDAECLKVSVNSRKQKLTMYFTSIHACEYDLNATSLPLALCQGTDELIYSVFDVFEKYFDCIIHPIRIQSIDMKWMTALWSTQDVENEEKQVGLTFKLPPSFKHGAGIDAINVKIDIKKLVKFYKKIITNDTSDMTVEDMEKFHSLLLEHVLESYGVNFSEWILTSIALPILSVASNGQIRIDRLDKVKTVLAFFTALTQEKFVTRVNPGLSAPPQ